MELDETKFEKHEGIHQVKQGQEYLPFTTNRSTNRSPGKDELRSMKPKKGGVSLTVEAWREGPTDVDDEVLYHVGEPGLGLDTLMSHL
jgi:hypothetical protein